ncbi:MAG: SMC family ATPase [Acidimicrobiales bacterium]|nr:SMC family ATPase [Acidimicrobiales bacterium]
MRSVRIEVEGFAAFRERAVVDLTDTDLFALVGPTGAGKSTVIDAMVFALYGSVPRYGSKGLVYPVITQGAVEAKVRLDFLVGAESYTATRVVRRTKTGATTKEARLERAAASDDEPTDVLADDADGLSVAVGELLGLDLEQFTKCVVLPQGAFATLLHDTKATRQDLLVKLLDLGLYERLASSARSAAKAAVQRIEFLDEQLSRSAHATPEAVAEAASRVGAIDRVMASIDEAAPELAALDERVRVADTTIEECATAIEALAGVTAPDDVADIDRAVAAATETLAQAEAVERSAHEQVSECASRLDALPDAAGLRAAESDRERLAEVVGRVEKGTAMLADAERVAADAQASVDAATTTHAQAETARDRARIAHAAADLARHLHEGDDCPVCGSRVETLPSSDTGALAEADRAVESAARALREASTALADADKTVEKYRTMLGERAEERARIDQRLAGAPTVEEIVAALEEIALADESLRSARSADTAARAEVARRRTEAERATARVSQARAAFSAVRDRVAAYGPPSASEDLAADWKELVQWADGLHADREVARAASVQARDEALADRGALLESLGREAEAAGVPGGPTSTLRDRTVSESASARARHDQLRRESEAAAELRAERATLDERRQVHELLAEQLGARGFEAWLLDEALDALLDGASDWLEQLSSGRYAMAVDDKKQFAVIDHANADERRLARTLSGGETFLASLALALALAERVTELSASGGTTLDAIFLDEGFGTLDPDTLDVVATAIEELGATGRMVGIISHVADLAERVPVRFEVAKSPGTSTVRRVDA